MSALSRLEAVWDVTQSFYGICFADEDLTAADMTEISAWCASHYRLPFFVLTDAAQAIAAANAINPLGYMTHVTTFHPDPLDVGAIMALALDQKFDQPRGIKTLKFKSMLGVVGSDIGENQKAELDAAGVNYYASYGNPDAPIAYFSQGIAGAGYYIDFVIGLHWLRNAIEVELFNTLRLNAKIDQTEEGMAMLKAAVARMCSRGVDNGLIAEGQWNGAGVGTINTGDYLPTGYYIYADKIRNQSQQDRNARHSQPITVLIKGAGALHDADITIVPES